jgi:hypothetical protein
LTGEWSYLLNVEPGKYLVVVNRTNPATEAVPLVTTYFPSSETESGATAVDVADDVEVADIDIQIHRTLTPRYSEVKLMWANGKPASGAYAYLTQSNQAPVLGGVTHTNAEGRARLPGFMGLDYLVLTIELAQEASSKQEDEARSAAYATQER